ncbi:MAG: hypothetical protein GKC03_05305 [Methanomassiliicoccales archaeon]|nr:hypothetical protein [Methanomassiliicoccales archaeon]NYT15602.1 hypothetical protein [Methanomassiliicoccales archaeon]
MTTEPYCPGTDFTTEERSLGSRTVREIDVKSLKAILSKEKETQRSLSRFTIEERLKVIGEMGKLWQSRLDSGDLGGLATSLASSTGYDRDLMEVEFSFIGEVLSAENIRRNLDLSLPQGIHALDSFVDMGGGEFIRQVPAGPVLIISSGNSIIPPLIPTVVSLMTGNLTLLKPSLANYEAIVEVMSLLGKVDTEAGRAIARSLVISHFSHDSPSLDYLLSEGNLGVVNFWGGEPARGEVGLKLCSNPHHPAYFVNGPLTGIAIVDEGSVNRDTAAGLALNIVLYDQQLCSSPTSAVFIGDHEKAREFVSMVAKELDDLGADFGMRMEQDAAFLLQSARRYLQFKGSAVRASNKVSNMWTVVLSKGRSALRDAVAFYPSLNIYSRKRFIEIITVGDVKEAAELVDDVSTNPAYTGVDKVQTVGLRLSEGNREKMLDRLTFSGVYRIVPLEDMFMRGAAEPYDGESMASLFTYALYRRDVPLEPE